MKAKRSVRAVARVMGKSRECVGMKVAQLGLEVVTAMQTSGVTTTSRLTWLKLPAELPSVEEQLKVLIAALDALRSQDIYKTDVLRLRAIIQGVRVYQELLADYVDYHGIEEKVNEMGARLDRLLVLEGAGEKTRSRA